MLQYKYRMFVLAEIFYIYLHENFSDQLDIMNLVKTYITNTFYI